MVSIGVIFSSPRVIAYVMEINGGGGGGGGGGYPSFGKGGTGGSGIVIIRYPNTFKLATSSTNATYLSTGTWNVYTFTQSGSITF